MPNPTINWRVSEPYPVSIAATSATVAEFLAAVKATIDGEAAGAGLWEVAHYSAGDGTLTIKRKGTPADPVLAAMRIILFGGSVPHAAACRTNIHTLANTTVYVGLVLNPATDAPEASYATGNPYPGKQYLPASGTYGTNTSSSWLAAADSPQMRIFEGDDVLGIVSSSSAGGVCFIAGRILERARDNALLWGYCSGDTLKYQTGNSANPFPAPSTTGVSACHFLCQCFADAVSTSKRGGCLYWSPEHAGPRRSGLLDGGGTPTLAATDNPYLSSHIAVLEMARVGDRPDTTGAEDPNFLGFFRQMRLGPRARNAEYLRDGDGALVARHIGPSDTVAGNGIWLDYTP